MLGKMKLEAYVASGRTVRITYRVKSHDRKWSRNLLKASGESESVATGRAKGCETIELNSKRLNPKSTFGF
ncbi:hypothetical protein BRAO285_1160003 [Bradyrhizobium sp. ORS 285]|nr:hypothetical protein BRAO285_1160003 [Bradyrhizobium sp. ORS 285]